jgi:hypothetical protein
MKSDWAWVGYIRKVGNIRGVSSGGGVQVVSLRGKVGSADGSKAAGWGLSGGEGVLTTISPRAYGISSALGGDRNSDVPQ